MRNIKKLSRTHSKKQILEMYSANVESITLREKQISEEARITVRAAKDVVWGCGAAIKILYSELMKANPDYVLPSGVAELMKNLSEVYENVNQTDARLGNIKH